MGQIGVITEQNDLGLNFNPLSKEDQKKYNNGLKNNYSSNKDDKKSSNNNK